MFVLVIVGAWQHVEEREVRSKALEELRSATEIESSLHFDNVDQLEVTIEAFNLPKSCWSMPSEANNANDVQILSDSTILELLETHAISSLPILLVSSDDNVILTKPLLFTKPHPSPDNITAWLRAGIEAYECLNLHTACEHMHNILTVDPNNKQALYNLACIFHTVECHVLAMGALKQLLLLDSKDHIAHNLLYNILSCHCPTDSNIGIATTSTDSKSAIKSKRILHIGLQVYQELIHINQDIQAIMRMNALLANLPHPPIPTSISDISSHSATPTSVVSPNMTVYQHQGHQEYIKEVFNTLSGEFESRLVGQLGYKAPWILANLVKQRVAEQGGDANCKRVLDLGCGSGLFAKIWTCAERGEKHSAVYMGEEAGDENYMENSSTKLSIFMDTLCLHACSSVLVGIDLSDKMVDICQTLCLYDYLLCAHITDCLNYCKSVDHRAKGSFDVVISADTFIYVGRLGEVFQLIGSLMPKGGLFAFSIEEISLPALPGVNRVPIYEQVEWVGFEPVWDKQCDWGVRLSRAVRYAHSVLYIQLLAKRYGFVVVQEQKEVLRMESNEPIMGFMYLLEKV